MDGAFTRCKLSVRVDEHPGRWLGPLPSICREKKRRCRRCAEMGVNLDGLKNAGPGSFLCLSLAIQITPFSVQQPGPGRPDVFSQSASSRWLGSFTSVASNNRKCTP